MAHNQRAKSARVMINPNINSSRTTLSIFSQFRIYTLDAQPSKKIQKSPKLGDFCNLQSVSTLVHERVDKRGVSK